MNKVAKGAVAPEQESFFSSAAGELSHYGMTRKAPPWEQ